MRKLTQNPNRLVLTVNLDGTFVIQSEIAAYQASQSSLNFVTAIPLPEIQQAINEVLS